MTNLTIFDSQVKAKSVLEHHEKPVCSISGGSDSDIVLDLIYKADTEKKVKYVWFNTGIEYKATKEHLNYLEKKYNIQIERINAIIPIPISCKKNGQPFLNKFVSDMISRLQKHNFKWEDKPYKELEKEYPQCKGALKWWCNEYNGVAFNIKRNKYLKEFMVLYHPSFNISSYCCIGAKKRTIHNYIKENGFDLDISGVRRAEGGIRSISYKTCFDSKEDCDKYRPIFWYTDSDKKEYEKEYNIKHSKCYSDYGFKRTGCCCCPFGKEFEYELEQIKKYENNLYKAVCTIFKDSYEYTRKYKEFVKQNKIKKKGFDQLKLEL